MPVKELRARFKGKNIRVVNTWLSGISLFIDEELRDKNNSMLEIKSVEPVLSSTLNIDGNDERVDVFAKAIFTTKLKIHVNNKRIAGDAF